MSKTETKNPLFILLDLTSPILTSDIIFLVSSSQFILKLNLSFYFFRPKRIFSLSLSTARLTSRGIPYEFRGGVSEIVRRIFN
ncbi:hypothetical protein L2E82_36444 [Cichorium intybus]|uniref:Uncharacterized protein n=1 Tax=Cichorium intybus TaxID=13427 RepID=A0ACB9BRW6_CICIN|nr:hypothetical protein L2E82_36444 [Cichorium intybus]